jgi:hypothetical protein
LRRSSLAEGAFAAYEHRVLMAEVISTNPTARRTFDGIPKADISICCRGVPRCGDR